MDTVTHVAGPFVGIKTKFIQRCMLCGEVLMSGDAAMMAVPAGMDREISGWKIGALVRSDAGPDEPVRHSSLVGDFDDDDFPDDFCGQLVEDWK